MVKNASTVGMMEGAFFVSRTELLAWLNETLCLNVAKVEQCASGSVYCQILDMCHPGTVAMKRVNWVAKTDHEFIPNYKVLHAAFDRNAIEKHVDVDRLIRAKYQDNLEFLQWMKCYWDREGHANDYNPHLAREGKALPPWARTASAPVVRNPLTHKENLRPAEEPSVKPRPQKPVPPKTARVRPGSVAAHADHSMESGSARVDELEAKVSSQQQDIEELRTTLDGMERERDYYFGKLREVEVFCTGLQDDESRGQVSVEKFITDIQSILYAEADEGEEEDPTP